MFQYYLFKINDRPISYWGMDIKKRNIDFLHNIDWEYFIFQAELFAKELDGENKQKAALAIRNIYHHAVETFFTLVCATIQAPHCIYAWMFYATPNDLKNVINKITKSDYSLFNSLNLKNVNWEYLSNLIHLSYRIKDNSLEKQQELAKQFKLIWSSLAETFLDDYSIKEYNAIKHGLRTTKGGFTFNIGPKGTLNIPERQKEWITVGTSEFGSAFYVIEQIKNKNIKDNPNYQSTKYHLNWDPKLLVDVIKIIAISINNFSNYLKLILGVEKQTISYFIPDSEEIFNNYWQHINNLSQMKFDVNILPEQIKPFKTKAINTLLKNKKD